jgi:hypothetical protein
MKYLKLIKYNLPAIVFLLLIGLFFYIYFIIYMTPSRVSWYVEMANQIKIFYQELTSIGK